MHRPTLVVAALLVVSTLPGCAIAMEKRTAAQRFQSIHGCKADRVTYTGSGYRVEGCGVAASYVCIDGHPNRTAQQPDLALLFGDDTCIEEFSERTVVMPTAPAQPPVRRTRGNDGEAIVRTTIRVPRATIVAIGAPKRDAARAVLVVRPLVRASADDCTGQMWSDGEPIPLQDFQSIDGTHGREYRFAVPIAALASMGRAERVAGSMCGQEFELDEPGRTALRDLEFRFREELTRKDATSGGVDVATTR